jgi:hypothetical protein
MRMCEFVFCEHIYVYVFVVVGFACVRVRSSTGFDDVAWRPKNAAGVGVHADVSVG